MINFVRLMILSIIFRFHISTSFLTVHILAPCFWTLHRTSERTKLSLSPKSSSNSNSTGATYAPGNFFGAWKALNQPNGLPEAERETPIKEVQ